MRIKYFLIVLIFSVSSFIFQQAQAQTNIYRLHALFLYNFTKHVQWSEVGDQFTVGVFGNPLALQEIKKSFTGKKFAGKDIRVINVAGLGDVKVSDLVYVPKSNKSKALNIFEDSDNTNTLFVSEDDYIQYGYPISFFVKGDKLGFKISKNSIESVGLKVSSSLLSLGTVVD